ncbi:MAG: aminomethyl-transferring glycine dehydrogenase subunit GcvPB [Spirochaetales bacterium]|nr:aminomethyl-transferring glycine dehydrogenase subunit GcvPB [Spirochaetales bacterium]
MSRLIFEKSRPGTVGYRYPNCDVPYCDSKELFKQNLIRREPARLPEMGENEVIRHFTELSRRNFGIDLGFYPLGSCTMKYNPRINEKSAGLDGFNALHPLQPDEQSQGTLEMMYDLIASLSEVTGMKWGTLAPFAGAHGEFTGMKLFKAYFRARGEMGRTKILMPDSAHGTNPASAHIAGFDIVEIKSDSRGHVDPSVVREYCDETLAGIMMTNPNTLGIFEKEIMEIAGMIHEAGGLLYYDGANMNAIMGKVMPGKMGFDCVHLNLHKTFSTPHGGGGPGAGPVFVNEKLIEFLPTPVVEKEGELYINSFNHSLSIGRVGGFHGNIGVLIRAMTYILINGEDGLTDVSEFAVLNANYLREKLKDFYDLPYDEVCKHEFVLSAKSLKENYGISALDIAKGLLDKNIHPPTIYFPLIVEEALMIEPTETETRETLDGFVEVMISLAKIASSDPDSLHMAPVNALVGRVDEVLAARKPVVNYFNAEEER